MIIHLVGRLTIKRPMRPGLIVKRQVALYPLLGCDDGFIGVEIYLLVCDGFPESFREPVVAPAACPVYADLNAVVSEQARELLPGKLAPLIGIEELRRAIADHGLLHRLQTEVGRQRGGEPPGQHPSTRPVEHRVQTDEAPLHRNVGDISGLHVIRA